MPFDTTKLHAENIFRVLPPTPPERGEGPRRVRIKIEVVQRQQSPRRYRVWPWLLFFLVLAALAHAQPRYEHCQSTDGWHGEIRQDGSTTLSPVFVGDTAYTSCYVR